MMFTQKNLMTVCCAAVLAFGLAACGSSSDDVKVMDTGKDTPPKPEVIVDQPPTDDEIAAKTKAAVTKATAIGVEAAQMDTEDAAEDAGLGGSDAPETDAAGAYSLSIERDRDGTTVEISLAMADDDDPKFMPGDDLDGGRTMLVRTMTANEDGEVVQEVVIVKTDIDAPTATAFDVVHELNSDEDGGTLTGDDLDDAVAINFGSGPLASTDDDQAVFLANMMSSDFAPPGQGSSSITHRFLAAADDNPDMDGDQSREAAMVAGYYDGAMGTYTCSGDATCTVDVNGKGELTAASDGWIFTPADGGKVKVYVADSDFLSYGFWLKNTTKDGATTYNEVETFAEATGFDDTDTTAEGLGAVTGTAMYKGGSVGVYVKNVLDVQANIVSATSGHFSADVDLTANFGGGDVKDNDQFTIGGMITGFVLQHGEANDWEVTLGLADFSGRTNNDPGKSGPGSDFDE